MDAHALSVLEFDAVRRHLAGEAFTEPGRREALGLAPCRDMATARWLQDETMEMRRGVAEQGRPPVDGAGDLPKILVSARIEGHPLDPEDLLSVASSLRAARAVLSWAGRIEWEKPRLEAVIANLRAEPEVEREISAAFDEQGKVADGASPALREIRRTMARLEERIRRRMDDILSRASSWLQDSFVTQRNGRWVIPVKSGSRSNVPGIVHDSSDSGATLYIEPASVVETGNDLAAATAEERVEVRRILTALSDRVRSILPALERNGAALAAIDLAAARARLAERLNAARAEIDDGCRVRLDGARHPLLVLKGVDAVPIDLRVGDDFRILVITGPNTGGKTVALKTTGLLHLMALAGLHIPARPGARIGAFTDISADIGDEQSIEQSLSTFSAHLRRIVDLLRTAGPRTLVLLDELGAGTDPAEGGALGCAILESLLASGSRVVATTHLTELKSFAATTPGVVNGNVLFDPETLSPLYTLEIGVPGRSNAFAIARRYGLPDPVVARAEDFLGDRQGEISALSAEIRELERSIATYGGEIDGIDAQLTALRERERSGAVPKEIEQARTMAPELRKVHEELQFRVAYARSAFE
ncbi:MAG: endonuclease MutS2, partial [Candidatus Brocadiae bacterium]|nr:endonuclease MutS2 [Candidatus Brocadiia bacterium]